MTTATPSAAVSDTAILSFAEEGRTPIITERPYRGSTVRVFTYQLQGTLARPVTDAAGREPVFVAAHGFRGDHHGFEQLAFTAGGTWVIPDFPGFGASTPMHESPDDAAPLPHDAATYAGFLSELAEAVSAEDAGRPVVVLGHSFGSVIVSRAAAALRSACGVVLINPISVPALEGAGRLATGAASLYYSAATALPEPLGLPLVRSRTITDAMTRMMSSRREPSVRAYVNEQHRAYFAGFATRRVLAEAYESSIRDSVREAAEDFALPTLLVTASEDAFGTPETQRALAERMPDARIHQIEGIGHLVHYEAAREAAEAISAFVQEL